MGFVANGSKQSASVETLILHGLLTIPPPILTNTDELFLLKLQFVSRLRTVTKKSSLILEKKTHFDTIEALVTNPKRLLSRSDRGLFSLLGQGQRIVGARKRLPLRQ